MSSLLKKGATKLRAVSSTDDMLAQMVKDGRKQVEELEKSLKHEEETLVIHQRMTATVQGVVDTTVETLVETRRFNLLHYAFNAYPENKTTMDCIDWLKKHPEVYEAFGETPE